MNITVYAKTRTYEFLDAKSWSIDELFLLVESKDGEKRFIKTDDIEDFIVKNVEETKQ